MTIELDNTLMQKVGASAKEVLVELAVAYYKQDRLSIGQACRLSQLDRLQFLEALHTRGLTVNVSVEDFDEDIENIAAFRQSI